MSRALQVSDSRRHQLAASHNTQEFVTMKVGGQLFGISVMAVQDVLRRQKNMARIPLAPEVIAGSLNLRGRIVTVIDIRKRLAMGPSESPDLMNVVVEYKSELFSLMVDSVGEVLSLPMGDFERTPPNLDPQWKDVALGVFKLKGDLLVILDVESLISMK